MNPKPTGIVTCSLMTENNPNQTQLLSTERETAIRDLIEVGDVTLIAHPHMAYHLTLTVQSGKLVFHFATPQGEELQTLLLSLSPYRRLIEDYFMMVESYEMFRSEGNLQKLETVDMARRGVHNEAAELLQKRLSDKISMDFESARRFFTLICVLQA